MIASHDVSDRWVGWPNDELAISLIIPTPIRRCRLDVDPGPQVPKVVLLGFELRHTHLEQMHEVGRYVLVLVLREIAVLDVDQQVDDEELKGRVIDVIVDGESGVRNLSAVVALIVVAPVVPDRGVVDRVATGLLELLDVTEYRSSSKIELDPAIE